MAKWDTSRYRLNGDYFLYKNKPSDILTVTNGHLDQDIIDAMFNFISNQVDGSLAIVKDKALIVFNGKNNDFKLTFLKALFYNKIIKGYNVYKAPSIIIKNCTIQGPVSLDLIGADANISIVNCVVGDIGLYDI